MKHKLVALLIFGFVLLGSCDFFAQNWEMGLHNKTSEQPIGFIKYNNFTYYYSNIKEYSVTGSLAGMYHHYLGINNDGSVKFDSVTAALAGGGIRVFPTMDKGMFVIYSEYFCQSQLNYNIPILIMIDSTGKRIFKTTIGSGIYPTSAEQLSKTCFVYSNQTTLNRFNPTNGIPTSTIYTSSGAISLMIKDKKSNLLFIESNKISLIDTSGTLLATKPSTVQYTKLTSYKSGYIGLKTGNNSIVHRFDSALNIIGTFSTNIYRLRDFSVYKDTVVFVGKKNLSDTSIFISFKINNLNFIQTNTVGIINHDLICINYDSVFTIASVEIKTPLRTVCHYPADRFATALYKRNSIDPFSFSQDIILKRVKPQFFEFTSTFFNTVSYKYQDKLVVYNNSTDTVKFFHVGSIINSHEAGGSSNCGLGCGKASGYDTNVTKPILPFDSIEVLMPLLYGKTDLGFDPNLFSFSITNCYDISVPNHKPENNIKNSSSCISHGWYVGLEENSSLNNSIAIYPNPVSSILHISTKISIETFFISDVYGKELARGKGINQIEISNLESGIYFITIFGKNITLTKKFVKT